VRPARWRRWPLWWLLAVAALVSLRLRHLDGPIDEPHAWRQMDTAHYIRVFVEEHFDLLRPSVCWMGPHRTLVLECPLPEALAAALLRAAGWRRLDVGALALVRMTTLLAFVGATWAFWRSACLLFGPRRARWAALLYLAAPLGQFYSRAVHIDALALLGAHGLLLAWVQAIVTRRRTPLLVGALAGVLVALVKAPYALPLLPPLLLCAWRRRALPFLGRHVGLLALPALALAAWQWHVTAVNAAAPDWRVIPDYHRFVDMWTWYFGTWRQRVDPSTWLVLLQRLRGDLLGPMTVSLLMLGGLTWPWQRRRALLVAFGLGVATYTLVFFNLNVVHDYYQLPWLALAALLAAGPLVACERFVAAWVSRRRWAWLPGLLLCALLAWHDTRWADRRFYTLPRVPLAAGALIDAHTPPGALVVAAWESVDARCPLLLYPARRYGFSLRSEFLTPVLLGQLERLGATRLALVARRPPREELGAFLASRRLRVFALPDGWQLFLFDL
jgi:hypothetical protein